MPPSELPPAEPPLAGDEASTLLGSLERQRATFAWKATGVDAAGRRARVGASSMTLGGLVKHLALVEDDYASRRLGAGPMPAPWRDVDWDADPDWEWRTGAEDGDEELTALWRAASGRCRAAVAGALEQGGPGALSPWTTPEGAPSVRRLLVDLVEEYARHVGHADLLREAVDGLVGEDPPR